LTVFYYSETFATMALILCRSYHLVASQVTVSEGLVQGPYVLARVEFDPPVTRRRTYQWATSKLYCQTTV